jgi:DNA-binding Lrp family transcriptional regulator
MPKFRPTALIARKWKAFGDSRRKPMMQLDDKAWRLLQALQADGRQPLKALAQVAGLSLPATAERIKRLEEAGAHSSRACWAEVSPAALALRRARRGWASTCRSRAGAGCIDRLAHDARGAGVPPRQRRRALTLDDRGGHRPRCTCATLIASINIYGETRTSIVLLDANSAAGGCGEAGRLPRRGQWVSEPDYPQVDDLRPLGADVAPRLTDKAFRPCAQTSTRRPPAGP